MYRHYWERNEVSCKDCGQNPWQASLPTSQGPLMLCGACADEALHNRESKDKKCQKNYEKLLKQVFGRWAAE